MQTIKLLAIASMLVAGTASARNNPVRDRLEESLIRGALNEQGFEQLLAAHVSETQHLPPSGRLEGAYVTLLTHALEPKNAFKMGTWALCVAPKSYEDGTVLIVDSVQTLARDKGPRTIEVRYRRKKTPGQHTTNQVWPYAVLFVKGIYDEVVCRSANG